MAPGIDRATTYNGIHHRGKELWGRREGSGFRDFALAYEEYDPPISYWESGTKS